MAISKTLADRENKYGTMEYKIRLGSIIRNLQMGQVSGQNGVPVNEGFDPQSIVAGALRYSLVSGTTSATANTQSAIPHNLGTTPVLYWVQVGNAYISAEADATNVYVASPAASQAVTVAVIY